MICSLLLHDWLQKNQIPLPVLAAKMQLSIPVLARKIDNKCEFSASEIAFFVQELDMPACIRDAIFFA